MNNIQFIEILSIVITMVSILAMIFLYQFRKLNKLILMRDSEEKVKISLQREKLENIIYKGVDDLTKDTLNFMDTNHLILDASANDKLKSEKVVPNMSYFDDLGIKKIDFQVEDKLVTCLMPFNNKYYSLYNAIKQTCSYTGFTCKRTDEEKIENNANLRRYIVSMIVRAQVVVAVLDGRNPNVLYEVGIAHAIGKLVILLVKRDKSNELPENLKGNRLLIYKSEDDLFEQLSKTLTSIEYA